MIFIFIENFVSIFCKKLLLNVYNTTQFSKSKPTKHILSAKKIPFSSLPFTNNLKASFNKEQFCYGDSDTLPIA